MDNIAFFPNASGANNSAASDLLGNLAKLGGEAGESVSFDALLSAQAAPDAAAETSMAAITAATPTAPQAGRFEDVSVIMQLLRVAHNEAQPAGTANAMPPDAAWSASDGDMPLPSAPDMPAPTDAETAPSAPPHPMLMAQMQMQRAAKPDALMTSVNKAQSSAVTAEPSAATDRPATDTPEQKLGSDGDNAAALSALQPMSAPTQNIAAISPLAVAATLIDTNGIPTASESSDTVHSAQPSVAASSIKPAATPPTALEVLQKLAGQDIDAPHAAAPDVTNRSAAIARDMAANIAPPSSPISSSAPAVSDSNSGFAMLVSQAAPVAAESVQHVKQTMVDFGERLLEIGNDDAWIDQLAKDIAATKSSTGTISFRLMPANLGRIDVAMLQNDQGVSVHVDAQNENAASLVAASQVRLVEELRQQGVRVNHTEVTHTANEAGRHSGQEQGRGQNAPSAPFIETAPEFFAAGDRDEKGDAPPKGRYA
jgi:flagellar hook-length control protein FliK